MNQYLIIVRPGPDMDPEHPTEAQMNLVGEHFAYLQGKLADGEVILVGRTQAKPYIGLCIFEVADDAAAEAFLANDPAVMAGVFVGVVQPYKVALMRGVS